MRRWLVALAIAAAVATSCSATTAATPSATPPGGAPAGGGAGLGEQRHEAGAVAVVATWIDGTSNTRVTLDTHSVDLDGFDLTKLARLRLDGGAWTSPSAWDAPKGGHHRVGTLAFATVGADAIAAARVVELEIRDVGVPTHLLRWERAR